jgi:hypothetical protein
MTTTDEESFTSFDTEDKDRRQKEAYRLYKHYAKPTKASMCKIVDYHANDTDITRQDVDLLPWNLEETEVIKEVMKSLKKKHKMEKKERKDKSKDKKDKKDKERERDDSIYIAFAKSKGDNKRPALLKGQTGDSSTSLDIYWNDITGSADISSTVWDQGLTADHSASSEQLQTIKVKEEHMQKREERRRKRDEVTKKSMSEVNEQERLTEEIRREETRNQMMIKTFLWYTRMGTPIRTEFKQQIAIQKIDISPEDVDLLAWNETGTRVKNIATMNAMLIRTRMLK